MTGLSAGAVIAKFKSDLTDFKKGIGEVKKSIGGLSEATVKASKTMALGVAGATAGLVAFGKTAVDSAGEYEKAIVGLQTVAKAFNQDIDATTKSAQALASDGLMSVAEASEGLKNLIATGFELPEAIKLMEGFKDSAAFNRQGTLNFGGAIVGATQGIKNQNSIMVDNAGVTKNLSNILVEAGLSANDLSKVTSDATVRQALFNGILKETSTFQGDAQKASETYQGAVSRLNTAFFNFKVTVGNELMPIITQFINYILDTVIPALTNAVTWIKENKNTVIAFAIVVGAILIPAIISWAVAMASVAVSTLIALAPFIALGVVLAGLFLAWQNNFFGIRDITDKVFSWVQERLEQLKEFWATWGEAITAVVTFIFEYIKIIFTTAFSFLQSATKIFFAIFRGDWQTVWDEVKNIVNVGWEAVKTIFNLIQPAVETAMQAVFNTFTGWFGKIWDKAKEIADNIRGAIAKAFDVDEHNSPTIRQRLEQVANVSESILNGIQVPKFSHMISSEIADSLGGATIGTNINPAGARIVNQYITQNLSDKIDLDSAVESLSFKYRQGVL